MTSFTDWHTASVAGGVTRFEYADPLDRLTSAKRGFGTSAESHTTFQYPNAKTVTALQPGREFGRLLAEPRELLFLLAEGGFALRPRLSQFFLPLLVLLVLVLLDLPLPLLLERLFLFLPLKTDGRAQRSQPVDFLRQLFGNAAQRP